MTGRVPAIFDRAFLRIRASRHDPAADFLRAEISGVLFDRLSDIRKALPRILDLGCAFDFSALMARPGTREVVRAAVGGHPQGADLSCDLEALPFAPESFDAVLSCLDLQWVDDLPGVLAQIRRILKPDGVFLAALTGGETLYQLRQALMQAELELTGGASPRVSPFADLRDMAGLLQRAGFALPVADTERITAEYSDLAGLMRDLRGMGGANAVLSRRKAFTRRSLFVRAGEIYRDLFALPGGRIPATFEIIHLIGWAPHESQPQPLKRGSATVKLESVFPPQN